MFGVEPMKTERTRMTSEANRTPQNSWASLPEQHPLVSVRVSDIVCSNSSLRLCGFSTAMGYKKIQLSSIDREGKNPRKIITQSFYGRGLAFKAITLPLSSTPPLHEFTLHYFLWEILFKFSNESVVEHNFGREFDNWGSAVYATDRMWYKVNF